MIIKIKLIHFIWKIIIADVSHIKINKPIWKLIYFVKNLKMTINNKMYLYNIKIEKNINKKCIYIIYK